MTDSIMYHEGNRRLQDQFDSRRTTAWNNLRAPNSHLTIGHLSRARRISFSRRQTPRDGLIALLKAACRGS
jgi:hypothetical protein